MNRFNNYHRHSHTSNLSSPDCNVKTIDYIKRAIELGEKNIFTTEHGNLGDIFEAVALCEQYGMNCKSGLEGYIVPNPLEKDKSNYHIICIPTTNTARKKLNKANSKAHIKGYYYKPRLFLEDLINNFKQDELFITSSCIGGLLKDEIAINQILIPLYNKFKSNLFLEIQASNHEKQKATNLKALELHNKLGIELIAGCDSHYIYPQQRYERLELLKGKGITYDDEDSFELDYPDYDTFFKRFQTQGIFTDEQIKKAFDNTLLLDKCENIYIDKKAKMPTIYPNLNDDEKIKELKRIINVKFKQIIKDDNIPNDKIQEYKKELQKEMKVIEDTKAIHTADYFLLNNKMIELATNKYNGVLTRTGRGSCGSYLINKILGITQVDRLTTELPIYSERFLSTDRLIEKIKNDDGSENIKALGFPDVDLNTSSQTPFIQATKELLGENGCYPMIAYGTMKESEAFRNVCRSYKLNYSEFNDVGKNIDNYRDDIVWKKYIEEANKYVGTIISASVHPCSFLLLNDDIQSEVGVVRIGENLCAMITSSEADNVLYLKNDYLIVSVWDIIDKVFKTINKPIMTVKELLNSLEKKDWDLLNLGYTSTLNQFDGDWATKLLRQYSPQSVEELTMLTSSLRPSFESFRDSFISRSKYSTGSQQLDELFNSTKHYILFQENLMQFFEWLSVTPAESIILIKKISKKKIKQSDFKNLEERIKKQWIINTGSIDKFQDIWDKMQSAMEYSYNTPHGFCTALDCLYGLYLKSNYPLEYYTVVLNMYENDKEKTARLLDEMKHFKLNLQGVKFRRSSGKYGFDKETNTIYKSISSIKDIGKNNGSDLYALRNNHYNSFIDLLYDIKNTSVNSKQLDILIRLNFFEEFGNINELYIQLEIYKELSKMYDKISTCKQIQKDYLLAYNIDLDLVERISEKSTAKQFKGLDNEKLIELFKQKEKEIMSNIEKKIPKLKPTTTLDLIKNEIELLGYTTLTDPNISSDYYIVENINLTSYGVAIAKLYNIKLGFEEQVEIDKTWYKNNPLEKCDIIQTIFESRPKHRKATKPELEIKPRPKWIKRNDWVETGEFKKVLKKYIVRQ